MRGDIRGGHTSGRTYKQCHVLLLGMQPQKNQRIVRMSRCKKVLALKTLTLNLAYWSEGQTVDFLQHRKFKWVAILEKLGLLWNGMLLGIIWTEKSSHRWDDYINMHESILAIELMASGNRGNRGESNTIKYLLSYVAWEKKQVNATQKKYQINPNKTK